MSISTTLSNALSGLTAASRSAQVVSSNVSNAMTEGYTRREIVLSARSVGGVGAGVRVDGVDRVVDDVLIRERRLSSSALQETTEINRFYEEALKLMGEPQDPSSLVARTGELDRSLLAATSRPESEARLHDVLNAATSLTDKLNDASDRVQGLRQDADREIEQDVSRLNQSLQQVADLNAQILRAQATDQDYPGLLDNRQNLIDEISGLIPVRELVRDNDTVALYSMNGAMLVDARPAQFEFAVTGLITADMTLASGALSGLTLNGVEVPIGGPHSPIAGGRLSGLFAVRDEHAPALQDDLDVMARDLVSRFEDPTMDPTLAAGDAGLFTDNGAALDPGNVIGLAARLSVNAAVNPAEGGAVWRLRDGVGAAAMGPVGDPGLLDAMHQRLSDRIAPLGGSLSAAERTVTGFASDILSSVGQSRQLSDARLSFQQAHHSGLDEAVMALGVDTDQELQKLLLVEQAYAANARVIQTADELIQLLIGL